MNNYEHLMQGGIDALLDIFLHEYAGYSCGMCAFDGSRECTDGNLDDVCRTGLRAWFEAEYREPDSLDKVFKDIIRISMNDGLRGRYEAVELMDIPSRIRALIEDEK